MDIKQMMETELREDFEGLRETELGSTEYKTAVDGMATLIDKSIELEKLELAKKTQDFENNLKLKQAREEKIDRWVKNILTGASIVIPSVLAVWGTYKTFKFEETGTVTTIMGRGFINKLLPKK